MKDCKKCGGSGVSGCRITYCEPCPCLTDRLAAMEKVEKHYEETIPKYHAEIYELRDRLSLLESQAVEREKTNQMLTTELVKQEDRLAKLERLYEVVKAYHEYEDRYVFHDEGDAATLGDRKIRLRIALASLEDT